MSEETGVQKSAEEIVSERLLGAWMSASAARLEASPKEMCDRLARAVMSGLEIQGFTVTRPVGGQPDVNGALDVAKYGKYDGGHHKDWVIDQMVRYLTGCPLVDMVNEYAANGPLHYQGLGESDGYRGFLGDVGHWSEGIAP